MEARKAKHHVEDRQTAGRRDQDACVGRRLVQRRKPNGQCRRGRQGGGHAGLQMCLRSGAVQRGRKSGVHGRKNERRGNIQQNGKMVTITPKTHVRDNSEGTIKQYEVWSTTRPTQSGV